MQFRIPEASKLVVPHQVRVGVPAACKSLIHSSRDFIKAPEHGNDIGLLKINFINAFNLVDRQTFIIEVKADLPSIYNWTLYCYGNESILDYNGFTISSLCGVQQDYTLGPLFFRTSLKCAH